MGNHIFLHFRQVFLVNRIDHRQDGLFALQIRFTFHQERVKRDGVFRGELHHHGPALRFQPLIQVAGQQLVASSHIQQNNVAVFTFGILPQQVVGEKRFSGA